MRNRMISDASFFFRYRKARYFGGFAYRACLSENQAG